MQYLQTLSELVGGVSPVWRTRSEDWVKFKPAVRSLFPPGYFEVLNRFGHGRWGENLILLHPLARMNENLSVENLTSAYDIICQREDVYPRKHLMDWPCIPVSVLNEHSCLLWFPDDQEIVVYDIDFQTFSKSGISNVAEFLVSMISNQNVAEGIRKWRDFNFDKEVIFTPVDPNVGII